jgi:hypothetical protein
MVEFLVLMLLLLLLLLRVVALDEGVDDDVVEDFALVLEVGETQSKDADPLESLGVGDAITTKGNILSFPPPLPPLRPRGVCGVSTLSSRDEFRL